TEVSGLLPNMSANATIITATKNDVLLVPTTAIITENGTPYIRLMKNKQITNVEVAIGLSSDSQTEILSGVNENDMIVTSVTTVTSTQKTNTQTSSPFSPFGRTGSSGTRQMQIMPR
ncbi:MAG TPA: hypothetical protein VJB96_03560, partial [Patescibacteria group bacterium]|nr:hypothetical protein [Patescibacteria group bacterium]